ncbi:crossover junction endodeoxyribonuclease RusA [Nocardia farcinica]|uniref:Uncharacterized protein n=1 Tax=Nocardia farcinica TaxID=37329 RepID=A0A0H5PPA0_NOCFR|nr:hypothetical protein [Nocardia farcinica]PFW98881.1 hypothetical protein CJ469_05842 [Nocardia farcinica]PFX04487.1 hypothetical protein CJ468_05463 [Nocardia farcinica]CRY84281.1 Uncharacterised protein [Nocardia farcinica]SIT34064.1 crossover junction endodeoxyribonuclease RusA [Nocardia farcinica]
MTALVRIDLPWTSPPLSMNDRGYTRGAAMAKAAKTREIRETIIALATQAKLPRLVAHAAVQLHYQPRDNRRRDTDNLVATLKPIADALTVSRASKRGTVPGYGLVLDDTPQWMAKPEPLIHPAVKGEGGRMWIEITYSTTEEAAS